MASVLAGLARNTGLKEVLIQSESSWTDRLNKNESINILDLTDDEGDSDY
jgi:hypothetical protein